MPFDAEIADSRSKMEKALGALSNDFKHVRTGRATVGMVEHVQVEAYGSTMPITQVASLSVPEPTQILIKPWDKSLIKALEKALADANLGMNPQSDGTVVRLNLPPLSTERRQRSSPARPRSWRRSARCRCATSAATPSRRSRPRARPRRPPTIR